jgi:hypothetical protein
VYGNSGTAVRIRPEPVYGNLRNPHIAEVWHSEPYDFTPWLGDHLEVLDRLGLGRLTLIEREMKVPGTLRALDLLAQTPSGGRVAIENQFGRADHDHLTRGLAYAVGLQAEALVVVAEAHLNEFRAVASYLNDVAERSDSPTRIAVFLVEVSVERVAEYFVPRFAVIEQPNPWNESVEAAAPRTAFATMEEFMAAVTVEHRPAVEALCSEWIGRGGTYRLSNQNVSLDLPHPTKQRPLSYLVIYTNGQTWFNRGYLRDTGALSEDRLDAFDEWLTAEFPAWKFGQKGFYVVRSTPPPPEEFDSLMQHLQGEPSVDPVTLN